LQAWALLEISSTADTGKIMINPGLLTFGSPTRDEIEALAKGHLPCTSCSALSSPQ
jgi:hypothetical protein